MLQNARKDVIIKKYGCGRFLRAFRLLGKKRILSLIIFNIIKLNADFGFYLIELLTLL